MLLEVLSGYDCRDSTCVNVPVPEYSRTVVEPLSGLKIGIAAEHFTEGLDLEVESAVRTALDVYKSLGAEIVEITLPHSKYAIAAYYLIAPSEASSNLARYDGVHYGHRTADPGTRPAPHPEEPIHLHRSAWRVGDQPVSPPHPRGAG